MNTFKSCCHGVRRSRKKHLFNNQEPTLNCRGDFAWNMKCDGHKAPWAFLISTFSFISPRQLQQVTAAGYYFPAEDFIYHYNTLFSDHYLQYGRSHNIPDRNKLQIESLSQFSLHSPLCRNLNFIHVWFFLRVLGVLAL